jgi:thiamine-phosphate pyrophosphorylase
MHKIIPELKGLYAITDQRLLSEKYFGVHVEQALLGGAQIIQYRDKSEDSVKRLHQAQLARQLCYEYDALLIINDDIQLADHCNADGVHLGKDDASIEQARDILGSDSIIGVSCYDDFARALAANHQQASYIAFGAFYASPTKPHAATADIELIHMAKAELDIPVCAIGGITSTNAKPLIDAGADMVAVITDVFDKEDIKLAAQQLAQFFR